MFDSQQGLRVLVVGGAGYIGSHVVLHLLDQNHNVTVLDDLSSGWAENIPEQAHFFQADILEEGVLERFLAQTQFDAVVHLAALKAAGDSMQDPTRYGTHNIWGTMRLLHAGVAAGIKHWVFSSSAAVYGDPVYLPVDEKHPCEPSNFYGYTKLAIERYLAWFERLHGLRFVSLRYFNAAGYDASGRVSGLERDPRNLIPIILEVAKGWRPELAVFGDDYATPDGTCIRDYIHVTDLAEAHGQALTYLAAGNPSLLCNLGSQQGFSVREVLAEAEKVTGAPVAHRMAQRRAGDPPHLVASAALAKAQLGWEAKHSSLENILKTAWSVYSEATAETSD